MFGLVGRMCLMACLATSPFGSLIDMHEMEIQVAVTKVSQLCGLGVESNRLVVTLETHCIILSLIRHVEIPGKGFLQNERILAAVRIVTGIAVPLLNRAVKILLLGNILTHISMTGKA